MLVSRRRPLMPSNARATNGASALVEHVVSMQQRKMNAAFGVQGLPAFIYNQLRAGRPCSCKSADRKLTARLNSSGKADAGIINELVTGHVFEVTPYSSLRKKDDAVGDFYDPNAMSDFDIVGSDPDLANKLVDDITVGDNGVFRPDQIDEVLRNFDPAEIGYSDISCPICFGSGYVGGYSVFRGYRMVATAEDFDSQSMLIVEQSPFALEPGTHLLDLVLPKGLLWVDAIKAYNGSQRINAKFVINDRVLATPKDVLRYCTGTQVTLAVHTDSVLTHIEIQGPASSISSFIELPKRGKSSDLVLDPTEPFQILLSPDVPLISVGDVIIESQEGKALIVQNTTPWASAKRKPLGHEVQVRVAQPTELFKLLPRRGRALPQAPVNAAVSTHTVSTGVKP